jgi:hypothetical protein
MTTPTPTTEPFDAFEQRLAAVLATEADTVAAPGDGLDRIRASVAHRRRARRATWFAAAAVLVLIAGIVGLALRPTDQGSTPYVDTTTPSTTALPELTDLGTIAPVDDRPLVPARTQPAWLALPGPAPAAEDLRFLDYANDTNFSFDSVRPLGEDGDVSSITLNVRRQDLSQRLGEWVDVEIGDRPAVTGTDRGNPVVIIDLGNGWGAELNAGPVTSDDAAARPAAPELLPDLVQLAEQLEVRGAGYWVPIVDRQLAGSAVGTLGHDSGWAGYRLGLQGDAGRSYVGTVDPLGVRSELTVPGTPDGTYMLRTNALATRDPAATEEPQPNLMPPGASITVRGHDGVLGAQMDNDDTVRRMLAWQEDGYQFRLYFSDASTLPQALALAEQLRPLDDDNWAHALFADQVPTTLTQFLWMWAPEEDGPGSTS